MVESSLVDTALRPRSQGVQTYLGVQYLRAFAAIAVVVFHAAQRYGVDLSPGARGVDVFFVISGFIMWTLTSARPRAPGAFLIDRIKRIVPSYWLATAAIIVAELIGAVQTTQNDIGVASVLKSLLFVPYVARGATEIWPILPPGWTLNYEMFFYAVFAAFLFTPVRVRLWGMTATFFFLIGVGAVFRPGDPILATYTNALIGHFLAGVWVAEAVRRGFTLPSAIAPLVVVGGTVALCLIPWHGLLVTLACGLASTAIVFGVVSIDRRDNTPGSGIAMFAGNASYSIYLWHGFAVSIVAKATAPLGLPIWVTIVLGVACGIGLGMIAFLAVEKPIRKRLSPAKAGRPRT